MVASDWLDLHQSDSLIFIGRGNFVHFNIIYPIGPIVIESKILLGPSRHGPGPHCHRIHGPGPHGPGPHRHRIHGPGPHGPRPHRHRIHGSGPHRHRIHF